MCSRSFGEVITDKAELMQAISHHTETAARRLREQGSMCLKLSVFARTSHFGESEGYRFYKECRLENPSADTCQLIALASAMVEQGYRAGYKYAKAGVRLSHFFDREEYQLNLFNTGDNVKNEKLMQALDQINAKHGEGSIKIASSGLGSQKWQGRRLYRSPAYTTNWNQLPKF